MLVMKYALSLSIVFLSLVLSAHARQEFNPEIELSELSTKKGNIGVAAGYSIDGEIKWSNAVGHACLDDSTPFTPSTSTRIASISKSFTAVAIMQLHEKNQLNLDTLIQVYLPDFPIKEQGEITIRQLLAHTSGVSQYLNDKEIESTTDYASLQDAVNVFKDRPLLFKPGTQYYYTTYGYVILGRIIEAVSGLNYGDYMQVNIFEPSGMTQTGIETPGMNSDDRSCIYHKGRRRTTEAKYNNLSNRVPGGGFYSTLEDVIKFGKAVLEGKLIQESTFRSMLQSQPVEYDGNKYGLGWYFYGPAPTENVVIGHSGGQTGCTSQLMIIPSSKTVVVVLSNTSGTYPDIVTLASNLIGHSESRR